MVERSEFLSNLEDEIENIQIESSSQCIGTNEAELWTRQDVVKLIEKKFPVVYYLLGEQAAEIYYSDLEDPDPITAIIEAVECAELDYGLYRHDPLLDPSGDKLTTAMDGYLGVAIIMEDEYDKLFKRIS